jgi:type IV secretory pathway TrbD component
MMMGGERTLVLVNMMFAAAIGIPSASFVTMGICAVAWFVGHRALMWMAEIDPQLSRVYLRSLKYRSHYPARGRVGRRKTSPAVLIFLMSTGLFVLYLAWKVFL